MGLGLLEDARQAKGAVVGRSYWPIRYNALRREEPCSGFIPYTYPITTVTIEDESLVKPVVLFVTEIFDEIQTTAICIDDLKLRIK